MRKSAEDIWAGVGFLAVAAAFGVQYGDAQGVSRVFPEALIAFITAGGVYFVLKGLWRRRAERRANEPAPAGEHTAWRRVAIITVLGVIYALLVTTLGFYTATVLFLIVASVMLDDPGRPMAKKILSGVVLAVLLSTFIWFVFTKLLLVPTPEGILF